jgi:carbamoyltransferase
MDALWSAGIALRQYESLNPLLDDVAARLATGKMIAWVCGRMETGPRALGRRSILASPLITGMRRRVSEEIKGREWFRPIAPISPASQAEQWFDGPVHKCESMLFAVRCKSELPEITHADGTARLQTVHLDTNPELLRLLSKFAAMTDVPILMNTSLNPRGKPIINQVSDAVTFLAGSELDALVLVDRLAVMDKASLDR